MGAEVQTRGAPGIAGRRAAGVLLVLWALVLAAGCAEGVGVRRVDLQKRFDRMDRTALNDDVPSERTLLYLRRHAVETKWQREPEAVLTELDALVRRHPDREALFALMELSYIAARRAAGKPETAAMYSLSCVLYAYNLLFDPAFGPPSDPYHPHSRDASDFYNRSLASFMIHLRERGIKATPERRFAVIGGDLAVVDRESELKWSPQEFDTYFAAYEFMVEGIENLYQTYGLGVPVILVRTPRGEEVGGPDERFLPKLKQVYAATAFLRVAPFLSRAGEGRLTFEGELQVFDPVNSDRFSVGERPAPIEADFTTPLAYMIGQSKLPPGISGVLDAASWQQVQGLHMLQPYQKDKIPVVFVHGLMSSPLTWLAMFNDLGGDPVLRKHYQFWFFMYPTGNPILYSAAVLRDSLNEVRRHFDPEHDDPAFNRMVLVGHSMGGVLSHLMVIDSGDRFWRTISDTPFDEADLDPEQRELARKVFFFDSLPYVSRVVFIAAPHRGSEWADYRIGRLGSWLVKLPLNLLTTSAGLLTKVLTRPLSLGQKGGAASEIGRVPTGIDGLSPSNRLFDVMNGTPVRPGLPYHSIIGNTEAADTPAGGDGIVPYPSAHLEGAASEKIVQSGHSAHNHPLTILEVHRILMLHLDSLEATGSSVTAGGNAGG